MLILRRRSGEAILIGDDIKITVLSTKDSEAQIAIEAPKEVPVLRSELYSAMVENRDAAKEESQPQELLAILGQMQHKAPKPEEPEKSE